MAKLPFESEIGRMLEQMYPLIDRSPDTTGRRFTVKKKFDWFGMTQDGYFVAVECKATRTGTLPFSRIPKHQREALSLVDERSDEAYLALNFRDKKGPGQAWLIPWGYWLVMEERWPKKSIRREEAMNEFWKFSLERVTGGWRVKNVHGPRITLNRVKP